MEKGGDKKISHRQRKDEETWNRLSTLIASKAKNMGKNRISTLIIVVTYSSLDTNSLTFNITLFS